MVKTPSNDTERTLFMTPEIQPEDELAELLEATVDDLRQTGLEPTDLEVEYYDDELWGYIWLAETPENTIDDRKKTAENTLRSRVNSDADVLPTTVNINYGDTGDYGIAIWWS